MNDKCNMRAPVRHEDDQFDETIIKKGNKIFALIECQGELRV